MCPWSVSSGLVFLISRHSTIYIRRCLVRAQNQRGIFPHRHSNHPTDTQLHAHFRRLFPVLTERKGGHVSRVPCGPLQACPRGNCGRVCTLRAGAHGVYHSSTYRPGTVGACMHEVYLCGAATRYCTRSQSSTAFFQSFSQLVRPLLSFSPSVFLTYIHSIKTIQQPTNAVLGNTQFWLSRSKKALSNCL